MSAYSELTDFPGIDLCQLYGTGRPMIAWLDSKRMQRAKKEILDAAYYADFVKFIGDSDPDKRGEKWLFLPDNRSQSTRLESRKRVILTSNRDWFDKVQIRRPFGDEKEFSITLYGADVTATHFGFKLPTDAPKKNPVVAKAAYSGFPVLDQTGGFIVPELPTQILARQNQSERRPINSIVTIEGRNPDESLADAGLALLISDGEAVNRLFWNYHREGGVFGDCGANCIVCDDSRRYPLGSCTMQDSPPDPLPPPTPVSWEMQ